MVEIYEFMKRYLSWILIPIALAFSVDLLKLCLDIVQVGCVLFVFLSFGLFITGVWQELKFKGSNDNLYKMRLFKHLPFFHWGSDFVKWAIEDVE